MNGLETMALAEKQKEKGQVCETNVVRRIVGVKRADQRRTDEPSLEAGVKDIFKEDIGEE